jgi:hypothetical protein
MNLAENYPVNGPSPARYCAKMRDRRNGGIWRPNDEIEVTEEMVSAAAEILWRDPFLGNSPLGSTPIYHAITPHMNDQKSNDDERRDALLLRLLKRPPGHAPSGSAANQSLLSLARSAPAQESPRQLLRRARIRQAVDRGVTYQWHQWHRATERPRAPPVGFRRPCRLPFCFLHPVF